MQDETTPNENNKRKKIKISPQPKMIWVSSYFLCFAYV
jgi:hypothetical protein